MSASVVPGGSPNGESQAAKAHALVRILANHSLGTHCALETLKTSSAIARHSTCQIAPVPSYTSTIAVHHPSIVYHRHCVQEPWLRTPLVSRTRTLRDTFFFCLHSLGALGSFPEHSLFPAYRLRRAKTIVRHITTFDDPTGCRTRTRTRRQHSFSSCRLGAATDLLLTKLIWPRSPS